MLGLWALVRMYGFGPSWLSYTLAQSTWLPFTPLDAQQANSLPCGLGFALAAQRSRGTWGNGFPKAFVVTESMSVGSFSFASTSLRVSIASFLPRRHVACTRSRRSRAARAFGGLLACLRRKAEVDSSIEYSLTAALKTSVAPCSRA